MISAALVAVLLERGWPSDRVVGALGGGMGRESTINWPEEKAELRKGLRLSTGTSE